MSFEQHFKGFCEVTYSHFSILVFLINFRDFRVFFFEYRVYNENPEVTKNLYFLVYNTPMHVDLCFDHYFNCLSVKTDINKNRLNLIYSEGSIAFKTQVAAAWLAMWLNHCNFDVIWTIFLGFLKLRTHVLDFRSFWWVSVISEFSFLGIGLKMKTRKLRKIIIFGL